MRGSIGGIRGGKGESSFKPEMLKSRSIITGDPTALERDPGSIRSRVVKTRMAEPTDVN